MVSNAGNGVPATKFELDISNEGWLVVRYRATRGPCMVERRITSYQDFCQFIKAKGNELKIHGQPQDIKLSVTERVAFPEDWTNREDVIALVKEMRGDTT